MHRVMKKRKTEASGVVGHYCGDAKFTVGQNANRSNCNVPVRDVSRGRYFGDSSEN